MGKQGGPLDTMGLEQVATSPGGGLDDSEVSPGGLDGLGGKFKVIKGDGGLGAGLDGGLEKGMGMQKGFGVEKGLGGADKGAGLEGTEGEEKEKEDAEGEEQGDASVAPWKRKRKRVRKYSKKEEGEEAVEEKGEKVDKVEKVIKLVKGELPDAVQAEAEGEPISGATYRPSSKRSSLRKLMDRLSGERGWGGGGGY